MSVVLAIACVLVGLWLVTRIISSPPLSPEERARLHRCWRERGDAVRAAALSDGGDIRALALQLWDEMLRLPAGARRDLLFRQKEAAYAALDAARTRGARDAGVRGLLAAAVERDPARADAMLREYQL